MGNIFVDPADMNKQIATENIIKIQKEYNGINNRLRQSRISLKNA